MIRTLELESQLYALHCPENTEDEGFSFQETTLIFSCVICVQYCSPMNQNSVLTFMMVGGMFGVRKTRGTGIAV